MKALIAILSCAVMTLPAGATSRYSALQHSCEAIQSIIASEGAAIFRYPSPRKNGLTLYDRYVRNNSYCASHQAARDVLIPSSDTDRCPVRHCVSCDTDDAFCF